MRLRSTAIQTLNPVATIVRHRRVERFFLARTAGSTLPDRRATSHVLVGRQFVSRDDLAKGVLTSWLSNVMTMLGANAKYP